MTAFHLQPVFRGTMLLLALGARCGLAYAGIGDIDPGYGVNGKFSGYSGGLSGAILPDGGAASAYYAAGTLHVQLADGNGLPDTGFGPAGERLIALGLGSGSDYGMIALPGGDVLVALSALPPAAVAGSEGAYLVRISPNGTLNSAFGTNGVWQLTGSGKWGTAVQAMQAQPDGKILVAVASFDQFYNCAGTLQFRRLLSDGSADLQFGNQGVVTIPAEWECYNFGDLRLSLLPGGFIVVDDPDAGPSAQLLNASGIPVKAPTADLQSRLASFQSSTIVAGTDLGYMAGASLTKPTTFSIERLHSDLTPDTSFGSQGIGIVSLDMGPKLFPQSLAPGTPVNAGGMHIYGIGTQQIGASAQVAVPALFRLNSDATVDLQFGTGGVVGLDSIGAVYDITDSLEQASGAVLLRIRGVGVVRLLGDAAPSPGMVGFGPTTPAESSVAQGAPPISFTVVRSTGINGAVSVAFHTQDGTALAGRDYQASSGTLTWDDGDVSDRSITIQLLNGPPVGSAIPFNVVLDSPQGGAVLGNSSVAVYINPIASSAPVTPPAGSTSGASTVSPTPPGGGGAINELSILILLTLAARKFRYAPRGIPPVMPPPVTGQGFTVGKKWKAGHLVRHRDKYQR
jgi:hypothetical protein